MTRFRNVTFTSYLSEIKPTKFSYCVFGKETCPSTGRQHLQGYIEFSSGVSLKTAQERIGDPNCHIEKRLGTSEQAATYCKKDGDIFEEGIISNPGERTDLQIIKDNLFSRKANIRDMLYNDTISNFQQLKFAEGILKYSKPMARERPLVYWWYGATGRGKTYEVEIREGLDYFTIEPDCEWFDGYVGQEAALIDDFRGNIQLGKLLQILDKKEIRLKQKGSFVIWNPKRIYITSSKSPQECYKNCQDNINQLLDRLAEVRIFDGPNKRTGKEYCTEVGGNTKAPTQKELEAQVTWLQQALIKSQEAYDFNMKPAGGGL